MDMQKALEILKHIEELYVAEPDFSKLERMAENNPERVQAWEDAFEKYDLVDVLNAVDDFWNFKSSKSKPSVAQLRAVLVSRKTKESAEPDADFKARVLKCAAELEDRWGNFDKGVGERFKAQFGL